jgi:hypothetical protein
LEEISMPTASLRPYYDETLHDAARRIRRMLEQEEMIERRGRGLHLSNNSSRPRRSQHGEGSLPYLDRLQSDLPYWATEYEPPRERTAFGGEASDTQLA